MTDHANLIASQLNVPSPRVGATIGLIDAGNTLPFIARYRKEATGGLDEEQIRAITAALASLRALDERRATILAAIEGQGKLTSELRARIEAAAARADLEDLYEPYKQRRRTRASIAREQGLQGLADLVLAQPRGGESPFEAAARFVSEQVPAPDLALAGAGDIVAEQVSVHAEVRRGLRERALRFASIGSVRLKEADDERGVFQLYYDFVLRADRLRPHQVLALNRGETQKVLRVSLEVPERDWRQAVFAIFRPDPRSPWGDLLAQAAEDAAKRLLLPAIERDVRRHLTEIAERHAIRVFGENLRALLGQPPLGGHTVLGIDPGYRTGCKVAVVDTSGKVLETATVYPHPPQGRREESLASLTRLVERHGVTLLAIGNGTASRETERLAADLIRGARSDVHYLIVSEAGASVYSASPLARAELADLDVSLRGAVSIARRVLDPLAELVKIDPQAIGVGLYQHDVNQGELAEALDGVVEGVVNRVGVDVNRASPALLARVAGIGPRLAEKIVAHRDEHGPFASRAELKQVVGLGPKAFEQSAGFLRVRGSAEPFDATAIHPESYVVAREVARRAGLSLSLPIEERRARLDALRTAQPLSKLAAELGAGEPTIADILEQLVRPGRDPREDLPAPVLRSDVLSMDDLATGLRLHGTVRNVVDFGAFVDIGVKQDGLLHRSRIPAGTSLSVGDVIEVEVVAIEKERERIALGWPGREPENQA